MVAFNPPFDERFWNRAIFAPSSVVVNQRQRSHTPSPFLGVLLLLFLTKNWETDGQVSDCPLFSLNSYPGEQAADGLFGWV
jgi:hypothetical protein